MFAGTFGVVLGSFIIPMMTYWIGELLQSNIPVKSDRAQSNISIKSHRAQPNLTLLTFLFSLC